MKRTLLILAALVMSAQAAFCADTSFFGMFDTRLTSNKNLKDADDDEKDTMTYMDSKLVIGIESRFSDDLKGVASFEAGSIIWGIDGADYPVGRNTGGAASGDGINIETKNMYIDFNIPKKNINIKCGLMPFNIVDGIIAGDDAFGSQLTLTEEIEATINLIRIYQESLGTDNDYNTSDEDRRESFIDLELRREFNDNIGISGIVGILADRYNGPETAELDRDIYYVGAGAGWKKQTSRASIDVIFNAGDIKSSDVEGNPAGGAPVKIDAAGHLINLSGSTKIASTRISLQALYASGDDSTTVNREEGFIVPETSYKKDIAEILTRGELSDEIEGDDDYAAYRYIPRFNNVFFIKGGASYELSDETSFSASVVYAGLPEDVFIGDSAVSANKVGTEIDLKFSHVIYTADDQQKGLKLDLIAAYLLSGDVFDTESDETATINKASDISEFGIKFTYEF